MQAVLELGGAEADVVETEFAVADLGPSAELKKLDKVQWADVGVGLTGLLLFGLSGMFSGATQVGPSAVIIQVGPLLLTAPALLVGHQTLQLTASPQSLMTALVDALSRAGRFAFGLVPLMVFFSATSHVAHAVFSVLLILIGGLGMAHAARGLMSAESDQATTSGQMVSMGGLVAVWSLLTGLIGLRLAWGVLG